MRIITVRRLDEYAETYPDARASLAAWEAMTQRATWQNLAEARRDFPTADGVRVASARVVTIFNVRGNHYRLVTAVHYNTQLVYVLRFLTHAQYDKNQWKETL